LVVPQEGQALPADNLKFRWVPFDQSMFYEVRLATAEGDLVWSARCETSEIRLPAEVHLDPGEKYFVWILARLPEGKTVKSPAIAFQVQDGD